MFKKLRENFKLLRCASEIVGKEFEEKSYDEWLEQVKDDSTAVEKGSYKK